MGFDLWYISFFGSCSFVSYFRFSERDGGPVAATPSPKALSPSEKTSEGQTTTTGDVAASPPNKEANAFNGFDPLASTSGKESAPWLLDNLEYIFVLHLFCL